MKTLKTVALASAVSVGLLGSGAVLATSVLDGELGSTSTGNFKIDLSIGERARVWGLKDVVLNYGDGTNLVAEYTEKFCIFSNKSFTSNKFDLQISSGNGGSKASNGFKLLDSDNAVAPGIGYTIKIAGQETTELTSTVGVANVTGELNAGNLLTVQPNPWDETCASKQNMNITINVENKQLTQTGSYSDSVTLLVTPK